MIDFDIKIIKEIKKKYPLAYASLQKYYVKERYVNEEADPTKVDEIDISDNFSYQDFEAFFEEKHLDIFIIPYLDEEGNKFYECQIYGNKMWQMPLVNKKHNKKINRGLAKEFALYNAFRLVNEQEYIIKFIKENKNK